VTSQHTHDLAARVAAGDRDAELELIVLLGARWRRLREKYPEEGEFDKSLSYAERAAGWVALAVGVTIEGLMEEYYGGKEQLEAASPNNAEEQTTMILQLTAGALVQERGASLVGARVETPPMGKYPGGWATVTQVGHDRDAPEVAFLVEHPTWRGESEGGYGDGIIGVFDVEIVGVEVEQGADD
jgi:hypothetical protein